VGRQSHGPPAVKSRFQASLVQKAFLSKTLNRIGGLQTSGLWTTAGKVGAGMGVVEKCCTVSLERERVRERDERRETRDSHHETHITAPTTPRPTAPESGRRR